MLPGVRTGTVVVDTSTISRDTARKAAARLQKAGAEFLDAPVSGGMEGARKGTLAMGRNEWAWRAVRSQTDEAELRRMDVEVVPEESDPDAEPVTRLSGFLRQPGS